MGTRCVIEFKHGKELVAAVYRHNDGYPESETGVPADLERFFGAVEEQCGGDTRFSDPQYLAARFVVWQAAQCLRSRHAADASRPLDFLGVGVTTNAEAHGDLAYVYAVDCSKHDDRGRPICTYRKAR